MTKVLVISPHPDDETMGCGGTLLKHIDNGDELHWLIMTSTEDDGQYSEEFTKSRRSEIINIFNRFKFKSMKILNNKPATLDQLHLGDIIADVYEVIKEIEPNIVYTPYRGDAHSDHKIVFDASIACAKSFRSPSIKSVRVYETLSETDFGLNPDNNGFKPNYFVDIAKYLDKKIEILNIFASEMKFL